MMKPNILLIITDQQRVDTLGFRNSLCDTPNMDSLFNNGISFQKCLTPSPLCAPARTSIFTGIYPHQAKGVCPPEGSMTVNDEISKSGTTMLTNDYSCAVEPILPKLLESSGYTTSYAGKWHLGNDIIHNWFENARGYSTKEYSDWCKNQGINDGWAFNDYSVRSKRPPHMSTPQAAEMKIDVKHHGDSRIVDIAVENIKNRDKDKPFFTVCAVNGPHPPFKVPKPFLNYYDDIKRQIPCPPNFNVMENVPNYMHNNYQHFLASDYSDKWEDWQDSIAAYWGLTKLIDEQMGKLSECLKEENLLDNTIIIFVSDHGEMMGSHGLFKKNEAFEEALRVPMIVSAPWLKKQVKTDYPSSLIDIAPTILDLCNVKYDENMFEGKSLKREIENPSNEVPVRYLFSEHRPLGVFHNAKSWRMITDNKYKYVWSQDDIEQLYDLENDIYELKNIADSNIPEKALLRQKLVAWAKETNDPLHEEIINSFKE